MVLADADHGLQLLGAVDVSGGVVRAVQKNGPCLASNFLLGHAQRRNGEVVLQRACNRTMLTLDILAKECTFV